MIRYQHNSLHVLVGIALIWLYSTSSPVFGQENANDAKDSYAISIVALTADNLTACYCNLYVDDSHLWSNFFNGDPISLLNLFPLSLRALSEQGNASCENVDPAEMAAFSMCYAVAKHPSASGRCPFPVFPRDPLYYGIFSSGVEVFLRLQPDKTADQITAQIGDEKISLTQVTSAFVARRMTEGSSLDSVTNTGLLETRFSIQECANLRCLEDKSGQSQAILDSAELIPEILEVYRSRYNQYPTQLCELSKGDNAVIGGYLTNPFRANSPLCILDRSKALPKGSVLYIPEMRPVEGDNAQVVGYWLAVLGSGDEQKPLVALPDYVPVPQRAIRWIEKHPSPDPAT